MPRSSPARTQVPTASLYVRLSREAAAENLSKEGMAEDCRRLAAQLGLRVIATHIDDGVSGAVRNRPEFMAWLADAADGRAGTLITWDVDRLTREGVNVAAAILDVLEGKNVETGKVERQRTRLVDVKGLDSAGDETAFRFSFVIKAEVARAERERMRDRSRAAHRRLRAAGRWTGGLPPFGFRVIDNPDGPGKVLAIEPDEAAAVQEAVAQVLAGEKLIKVTRWMNSPAGHPPRRAQAWTQTTLYQTLTGDITDRNDTRTGTNGHPIAGVLGNGGRCPAIITADEAAALRTVLARKPSARVYHGRMPARLLSGLLVCHSCHGVLQVSSQSKGKRQYRCANPRNSGTCTAAVSIICDSLERYVTEQFLETYGDMPEYVRRAHVTGAAELEAAERAVEDALRALGVAGTPENFQALQEAQARRDAALEIPQEATIQLVPSGRTIEQAWHESDINARRDLLATNYGTIIIRPGKPGRPGVQPDRVLMFHQPTYVLEAGDVETYRLGSVVASVEN